eukprot:11161600-Lingulodinium_polyedra.AAC.1
MGSSGDAAPARSGCGMSHLRQFDLGVGTDRAGGLRHGGGGGSLPGAALSPVSSAGAPVPAYVRLAKEPPLRREGGVLAACRGMAA